MTAARLKFKKMAVKAARLADSKKAESIAVYDLSSRSRLADYVMAATVDSPAHLEAVDGEISGRLKKEGIYPLYRDGPCSRSWKVLDYGGLIIHIIERSARAHYALDEIFNGSKQLRWQPPAPAAKKVASRRSQGISRRKGASAPKTSKKPAAKKTKPKKAV